MARLRCGLGNEPSSAPASGEVSVSYIEVLVTAAAGLANQYAADEAELLEQALEASPDAASSVAPMRSLPQRRADALVEMAARALSCDWAALEPSEMPRAGSHPNGNLITTSP